MREHQDQWMRPEVVLDALLTQQARVAADIIEVEEHTWAIHGVTPVDGDVILAEFDRPEEALAVLKHLAIVEDGTVAFEHLDHSDASGRLEADRPDPMLEKHDDRR